MKKIIYYVASSIDGYISGKDADISGFVAQGEGVAQYLKDLKGFDTVIMGKNTYEFGYKYGLQPGQLAYPHMDHFIFSKSLFFENADEKIKIVDLNINEINKIRRQSKTDIYLCGGRMLAAWLLEQEQIDVLKLKLNPLVLGQGVKIFGSSKKAYQLKLIATEEYENGLQIMTYNIEY